jgi:hypothetical protein
MKKYLTVYLLPLSMFILIPLFFYLLSYITEFFIFICSFYISFLERYFELWSVPFIFLLSFAFSFSIIFANYEFHKNK